MTFAPAPRPGSAGPPPPRPQRPLWHWLLLSGAGMALLLVALIVALILLWQILGRGDPETTLDDFYDSLQTSDCALFEETTTPEYRDATGLTSCDVFEQATSDMTGVDYEVTDRVNRFGYAIFYVTERYEDRGETIEVPLRYFVERSSGQWGLAGIEPVDENSPDPITGS